jgi:cation diffusion facilitator CzcD-associated flavoprotein CzcO
MAAAMTESIEVAVVGAGQAGLAASHELSAQGVPHVVLERGEVGQTWRGRWNSFCLVTPNWTVRLPGHPYDGDDPDGYMPRDDIVAYLERYAAGFDAPVRAGVDATGLEPEPGGRLRLRTSKGDLSARSVVLATGAYQRPFRPAGAATVPAGLPAFDAQDYRSPSGLPPGGVLVVGSGQTGCQIAEELLEDGREVFLACGRAPWMPRRLAGRDIFWWMVGSGYMDVPISSLPGPEALLFANPQATGHGGGRDLHYRTLRAAGAILLGRFRGVEGGLAHFADDLGASVAWGDERYRTMAALFDTFASKRGLPRPAMPAPSPFDATAPLTLDLSDLGAVVFAGGFRPGYGSWVTVPGAFDELGFPNHVDGASTVLPGLYFVGVHFLRTRKSSLLYGVGEDAALVARQIAGGRA